MKIVLCFGAVIAAYVLWRRHTPGVTTSTAAAAADPNATTTSKTLDGAGVPAPNLARTLDSVNVPRRATPFVVV